MNTNEHNESAPVVNRRRKFNRSLFERVVANIVEGMQTHPAIRKEGISTTHFYRELSGNRELIEQFREAQMDRDRFRNREMIEMAEAELFRRGVEGWEEPIVDHMGKTTGSRRRRSDRCLIYLLRSLKPDVYGPKPTTVVENNIAEYSTQSVAEIVAEWRRELAQG